MTRARSDPERLSDARRELAQFVVATFELENPPDDGVSWEEFWRGVLESDALAWKAEELLVGYLHHRCDNPLEALALAVRPQMMHHNCDRREATFRALAAKLPHQYRRARGFE